MHLKEGIRPPPLLLLLLLLLCVSTAPTHHPRADSPTDGHGDPAEKARRGAGDAAAGAVCGGQPGRVPARGRAEEGPHGADGAHCGGRGGRGAVQGVHGDGHAQPAVPQRRRARRARRARAAAARHRGRGVHQHGRGHGRAAARGAVRPRVPGARVALGPPPRRVRRVPRPAALPRVRDARRGHRAHGPARRPLARLLARDARTPPGPGTAPTHNINININTTTASSATAIRSD